MPLHAPPAWAECNYLREPLIGLAVGRKRRRVGAGDTGIGHVFGPLGPRPVPLLMLEEWVGQPTGRYACIDPRALRWTAWPQGGNLESGAGGRPFRDGSTAVAPPPTPRREHPHQEQATEEHDGDPRPMPVIHDGQCIAVGDSLVLGPEQTTWPEPWAI